MDEQLNELKDEAIAVAARHIRDQRKRLENTKAIAACITALLAVAMVCGTVLGCYTVKKQQETVVEQQYALNMQYAQLMEYVSGAEVTTETIDGGNGGTAIKVEGDNNTTAGGDVNGED